jgi:hypothetical protein
MSVLATLSSLLASKAVAGAAAAGLAVAGTTGVHLAIERADDNATEQLQAVLDHDEPGAVDEEEGLAVAGDLEELDLDAGDDAEVPEVDTPESTDLEEEVEVDEETEVEEEVEVDEELEEGGTEGNGRSAEVHATLTGDADLRPGDEGFGQAVAANARENRGELGRSVAATASQGRSEQGRDRHDEAKDREDAEGSHAPAGEETGAAASQGGKDRAGDATSGGKGNGGGR